MSGSFFSEKFFLNWYSMILVSFSHGGCVDKVVDNRTNYQGYRYVYFLQYDTLTVISIMNGEEVCKIISRAIFNVHISSNHSWWCKHNQG